MEFTLKETIRVELTPRIMKLFLEIRIKAFKSESGNIWLIKSMIKTDTGLTMRDGMI